MPRPHTEFIQTQALPWNPGGEAGRFQGLDTRILSEDERNGGCSALLRYPAGFSRLETLSWAEECFVLDGSLTMGGIELGVHDYCFQPPCPSLEVTSDRGAVVLTFLNPRGQTKKTVDDESFVKIATHDLPWGAGIADGNLGFMGLGRKVLRDDVDRAERTLLITMAPQAYPPGFAGPQISHPCVEECYLLSGDIVTEYGTMGPGAYFWRPPNVPHGPHGSRGGAFMVIRFVEGHHSNEWSSDRRTFELYPEYRPVLPEAMRPYAGRSDFAAPF